MNMRNNTVLITGGTSGIGLTLAVKFLENDNEVIICGRDAEKLRATKGKYPKLHTTCCDVGCEGDRISMFETVISEYPDTNIIINNAGLQHRIDLMHADWNACKREIAVNFEAPIHLATLFVEHLRTKENAFIVNVTSGLAFMPPCWVPVYGATKAGAHSFTFSLREQLLDTGIGVVEIIPPAVNTNLGGAGVHTYGIDVYDFVDYVFKGFEDGANEIGFGSLLENRKKTREELESSALNMYRNNFKHQ